MSAPMDDKHQPIAPAAAHDEAPPVYALDGGKDAGEHTLLLRTQQPFARAQMSPTRNPNAVPVGLDGQRSWNNTLCSCCSRPGLTAAALCCPCLVYSANRSRLEHLVMTGEPIPSPQHVGLSCCLYALAPQVVGLGQVIMQCFSRHQTRQRYGIRGDFVQDTLLSAFCAPCALVQESREIEEEETAIRIAHEAHLPGTIYRDDAEVVYVLVGEQSV